MLPFKVRGLESPHQQALKEYNTFTFASDCLSGAVGRNGASSRRKPLARAQLENTTPIPEGDLSMPAWSPCLCSLFPLQRSAFIERTW